MKKFLPILFFFHAGLISVSAFPMMGEHEDLHQKDNTSQNETGRASEARELNNRTWPIRLDEDPEWQLKAASAKGEAATYRKRAAQEPAVEESWKAAASYKDQEATAWKNQDSAMAERSRQASTECMQAALLLSQTACYLGEKEGEKNFALRKAASTLAANCKQELAKALVDGDETKGSELSEIILIAGEAADLFKHGLEANLFIEEKTAWVSAGELTLKGASALAIFGDRDECQAFLSSANAVKMQATEFKKRRDLASEANKMRATIVAKTAEYRNHAAQEGISAHEEESWQFAIRHASDARNALDHENHEDAKTLLQWAFEKEKIAISAKTARQADTFQKISHAASNVAPPAADGNALAQLVVEAIDKNKVKARDAARKAAAFLEKAQLNGISSSEKEAFEFASNMYFELVQACNHGNPTYIEHAEKISAIVNQAVVCFDRATRRKTSPDAKNQWLFISELTFNAAKALNHYDKSGSETLLARANKKKPEAIAAKVSDYANCALQKNISKSEKATWDSALVHALDASEELDAGKMISAERLLQLADQNEVLALSFSNPADTTKL